MISLIFVSASIAGYYDSGYIEWKQPNGVTFIARLVWDEVSCNFETKDGYQIIRGDDYYYYYAILDENGDFKASNHRVGIDPPLKESYKLKRKGKALAEIEARRKARNEARKKALAEMFKKFRQRLSMHSNGFGKITTSSNPINMGIVLVEFSDIKRYRDSEHPNGYSVDDFNNMMFSTNHVWYDTSLGNDIHPEGDRIYGSFREYWEEQTNGVITFTENSGVIYPPGSSDPWHELSGTKTYYNGLGSAISTIVNELGLDNPPYDEYDKIAIIYASETFYGGGLSPHARYLNDRYYIIGERHQRLNSGWGFTYIGGHCHEFGHCLGLPHPANTTGEDTSEVDYYALMEVGGMCGPEKNGACPSGINPFFKISKGWVNDENIHYISENIKNLNIFYNYLSPHYYVVNRDTNNSDKFFILENRLRDGFDYYTPNDPNYPGEPDDPNGNQGGLLIWRVEPNMDSLDTS